MSVEHAVRRYQAGERVLSEGERGTEIYILRHGELTITRGRVRLGTLRSHGDVIGEIAALTGQPRSATVVASRDSELLCLRIEFGAVSARMPEILEKIDAAVRLRYEIAHNKALIYVGRAAAARRAILHEVMVQAEILRVGKKVAETQVRKTMRQRLDDLMNVHGSIDDPRVLKRIADEYAIFNDYTRELAAQPWLDDTLPLRLQDLRDAMILLQESHTLRSLRERAKLTAECLDALAEYEQMPGTVREIDIARLEEIIPLGARAKALRTVLLEREAGTDQDPDPKLVHFAERKVQDLVEIAKANAGTDLPTLMRAAEELHLARAYEAELRRVLEMTGTSSAVIDIEPPAPSS